MSEAKPYGAPESRSGLMYAWVPMKVQEKTLVEEVEEEIKEESDEEEYEIEKIVEMRVKQEGKVDVKNHPFRRGRRTRDVLVF